MKVILKHRRNDFAFTLVDVMVGMAVLGILLLSLFACFSLGFGVVKMSREELQATQVLQEKMESIRLYNWEQAIVANSVFTNSLGSSGPAFYFGRISNSIPVFKDNAGYSNNLRQITVTISWTNNNIPRSRSSTTYVSRYGLFKYTLN